MTTSVISLVLKFVPLARILLAKPTNMNLETFMLVKIVELLLGGYVCPWSGFQIWLFCVMRRRQCPCWYLTHLYVIQCHHFICLTSPFQGHFTCWEFYPKRASLQHCELFRNSRNCWKLFVTTDNQPVRFLTNSQTNTFTVRNSSNEQNLHIPSCYWNYIAVCLDANGVQAENNKQKFSTTLI